MSMDFVMNAVTSPTPAPSWKLRSSPVNVNVFDVERAALDESSKIDNVFAWASEANVVNEDAMLSALNVSTS